MRRLVLPLAAALFLMPAIARAETRVTLEDEVRTAVSRILQSTATATATHRAIDASRDTLGKVILVGLPMAVAALALLGAVALIASSIGFIILVLLTLVFFERHVTYAREIMMRDFLRALGIGLVVFFALIPVIIFLCVTILGIPLAIGVSAIAVAAVCLGAVAVCEGTGRELGKRFNREFTSPVAGLLGLTVMFLVGFVPVLGTIVHAIALFAGFGAVLQTRFRAGESPR